MADPVSSRRSQDPDPGQTPANKTFIQGNRAGIKVFFISGQRSTINTGDFMNTLWMWLGFNLFVLVLLALDLGILHRKEHTVGIREALLLSLGYFLLALLFGAGIFHFIGAEAGVQFFTG